MKRLLIASASLTLLLGACSSEEEPQAIEETSEVASETAVNTEVENPFAGASDVASNIGKEVSEAVDNVSVYSTKIDSVIIKVESVTKESFASGTVVDVNYYVENTVKDRKMVPLERTVIITDSGAQIESDSDLNNEPEWDLLGATKDTGTVSFYIEDAKPSEINSVDVVIPGVDFNTSLNESFEYIF